MRANASKYGRTYVVMAVWWVMFSLLFYGHLRVWFVLGGSAVVTVIQVFGGRPKCYTRVLPFSNGLSSSSLGRHPRPGG